MILICLFECNKKNIDKEKENTKGTVLQYSVLITSIRFHRYLFYFFLSLFIVTFKYKNVCGIFSNT